MKRTLLFTALLFASHAVLAADAVSKATTAADAKSKAATAATARASEHDTDAADAASAELAELRKQMQTISRRMAELSMQLGDVGPRAYAYRYIAQPDRAMIGVVLGRDKDKVGARISAVTPDAPAARAGLRDGDVITAIDQHPVTGDNADAILANARERLANLKDNQQVSIEYRRGDQKSVVVLAAQRREAWNWPALMNEDSEHPFLPKDFNERIRADVERATEEARRATHDAERDALDKDKIRALVEHARNEARNSKDVRAAVEEARHIARHGMPWWGINLAPVDADLGRYFGADKGALVISADNDSLPGLRAGDVITHVAAESVNRPEDVMRALRDQPPGTEVAIKVMRDHKALALNVKAPEFKSIFSMPPMPPAPPAPPAPPTPPVPPVARSVPAPPAPPSPPAPPTVRMVAPATIAAPQPAPVVPPAPNSDDE